PLARFRRISHPPRRAKITSRWLEASRLIMGWDRTAGPLGPTRFAMTYSPHSNTQSTNAGIATLECGKSFAADWDDPQSDRWRKKFCVRQGSAIQGTPRVVGLDFTTEQKAKMARLSHPVVVRPHAPQLRPRLVLIKSRGPHFQTGETITPTCFTSGNAFVSDFTSPTAPNAILTAPIMSQHVRLNPLNPLRRVCHGRR